MRFRLRWLARVPLRARVIAAFTLGALLAAALLVVITYGLSRESMLRQRRDASLDQFFANATQAQAVLRAPDPDWQVLLESLPSLSGSRSIIRTDIEWRTLSLEPSDLRPELQAGVLTSAEAQVMQYRLDGEPQLAIGLRLRPTEVSGLDEVAYFEVVPLGEIEDTLGSLGLILVVSAALVVFVGAGIGVWAAGRLLQPLTEISDAATSIARGRFDTRLEGIDDPDLAGIVDSFNDMAAAMEERIARDARFASDVSHELRSPLMTIRASIDVMQHRRGELSERGVQALDLLTDDVDRFEHLVQDLLEISRSDAGALETGPVNITELVSNTAGLLDHQPPIEIQEDARDALVMGDKRRLAQVLDNLLRNAEKYGDGATRIEIARHGHQVSIAVEDDGPGVAPSEREVVFERFTRGAAARKRGSGHGAGLGLALVDEHTRRHGGSAWVENKPDGSRGARFVVELPTAGHR
ncbi:MAG: HAMP domain-containing sensor histidine kinase [Actinomycetota bacterium]|jgi:two-component system, OmpR family, sensor histidine kinase MtrB|nr:HAMP domain-containing sensor histidine kinase [Actinomycetota bacterium]